MERLILIGFDQDGTVHLLQFLLSVPVGSYYKDQRLLELFRDLPSEPPSPLVMNIPVYALMVRCTVCAVPWDGHPVNVERFPLALLAVDTIREGGKDPVGHPKTGLPGADLLAPRRRLMYPRPRHQHHRGLLYYLPPILQ